MVKSALAEFQSSLCGKEPPGSWHQICKMRKLSLVVFRDMGVGSRSREAFPSWTRQPLASLHCLPSFVSWAPVSETSTSETAPSSRTRTWSVLPGTQLNLAFPLSHTHPILLDMGHVCSNRKRVQSSHSGEESPWHILANSWYYSVLLLMYVCAVCPCVHMHVGYTCMCVHLEIKDWHLGSPHAPRQGLSRGLC